MTYGGPAPGPEVRVLVAAVAGRLALRGRDREDLEQELMAGVLERMPAFDPARGPLVPFLRVVLDRLAVNLVRRRRAAKRDRRREQSLDRPVKDEAGHAVPLSDTVGAREHDARRRLAPRDDQEAWELRQDVAALLATLPDDQRELAGRLMYQSVSAAARDLNVARSSMQTRVRKIRERFESSEMRDFL